MNNPLEFKKQIRAAISHAEDSKRINFGLRICHKLFPDYEEFERINQWGKSTLLLRGIELIEATKDSTEIDEELIDEMINEIDKVTPDTEKFSNWDGSFALNAALSVSELLIYLKDRDYSRISDISSFMLDSIDFKIQMNNETIVEPEIDNHPMLLGEIKNQLEAIK